MGNMDRRTFGGALAGAALSLAGLSCGNTEREQLRESLHNFKSSVRNDVAETFRNFEEVVSTYGASFSAQEINREEASKKGVPTDGSKIRIDLHTRFVELVIEKESKKLPTVVTFHEMGGDSLRLLFFAPSVHPTVFEEISSRQQYKAPAIRQQLFAQYLEAMGFRRS